MSSHSQPSKLEKEKQRLIQEKCQSLLNEMLRDDDNKYCVDCDAKGPRWASWNLGIFLCIRCAGIHRNLGVHISRVKSVNLDTWKPDQVVTMQQMGNSRARAVYEASLPDNHRRPQTDVALENFIRAKYEHKKYIAQEWVQPKTPIVNWDSEIEESLRKKKEVKKQPLFGPLPTSTSVPIPKPKNATSANPTANSGQQAKPKPVVIENNAGSGGNSLVDIMSEAPAPVVKQQQASDDLFGLSGLTLSNDPVTINNSGVSTGGSSGLSDLSQLSNGQDLLHSNSNQKMTKESIMSLYGSGTQQQQQMPQQMMQQQQHQQHQHQQQALQQNPFANAMFGGGGGGGQNMWNPNPYQQQQQQQQQPQQQQLFGSMQMQPQSQPQQFFGNQNQFPMNMTAPPTVNLLAGIQTDISPRPEFNWASTNKMFRN